MKESFNKNIDVELLRNDFAYYADWKYGPISSWSGEDHFSLKLMKHDFGYWLIIARHASGENIGLNIGSSNDANEIIKVRDALKILQ